jgi:hypothetical protein
MVYNFCHAHRRARPHKCRGNPSKLTCCNTQLRRPGPAATHFGTNPNDASPTHTLVVVRHALERAGVEFIDENGGGPGVPLRKRQHLKKSK